MKRVYFKQIINDVDCWNFFTVMDENSYEVSPVPNGMPSDVALHKRIVDAVERSNRRVGRWAGRPPVVLCGYCCALMPMLVTHLCCRAEL